MVLIQGAPYNILHIRNIIYILDRLPQMFSFLQSCTGKTDFSCSTYHQADIKLSHRHTVPARRIGKLQSCLFNRAVIHGCRGAFGHSHKLHA